MKEIYKCACPFCNVVASVEIELHQTTNGNVEQASKILNHYSGKLSHVIQKHIKIAHNIAN